jgi:hypothetical protein
LVLDTGDGKGSGRGLIRRKKIARVEPKVRTLCRPTRPLRIRVPTLRIEDARVRVRVSISGMEMLTLSHKGLDP